MPRKRKIVGKARSARKKAGSKARRAKPRKAAARRLPPSPIVFEQPGTISFAILLERQDRERAASR